MFLIAMLLSGCGQKGPLVLPGEVEPPLGQAPVPQIPAGNEEPGDEDENEGEGDDEAEDE